MQATFTPCSASDQNKPSLFLMNTEQQEYISLISRSTHDDILIKKIGWEAINFQEHAHEKFQIIYTLSGTLHVETGGVNYFVPEKASHKLSSNSRQVSLIIFILI